MLVYDCSPLLAQVPTIISRCNLDKSPSTLTQLLSKTLIAITAQNTDKGVDALWKLCRNFEGKQNEFKQLSTSSFLDYLFVNCSTLLSPLLFEITEQKSCTKCLFVWEHPRVDAILRLHFPKELKNNYTLEELLARNFKSEIPDVLAQCVRLKHNNQFPGN